ncbi:Rap1-interacting factor 1 N terminal-domain-containing protein [Morchella snyderi]|nr:Rap1-interacting factor 1 N terminal-domain-containing protein [Morchella snyderi]
MVVNTSSDSSPFFPTTTSSTSTATTTTTTTTTTTANNATPKRRSLDNNGLPRPPTPPRESPRSKKALTAAAKDPFANTDSNILVAESSPPPSSESSAVDKPKKRVLWSPWTKYHKPDVPLASTPIRSLIDAKNLKSILKPSPVPLYTDSPLGRPIAAHTFTSFASMLESVLTSLASPERSRKLDTYITFSNTLKAYDDVPDMPALETHLPALCGFIRRDLTAKLEDGGNTDSQLIQQAIKLLVILAWTPRLVEAIDDTNAAFFIEHAIARIEDASTPKILVNHNMHLIAQQKFPARIMTAERANRIVTALETLDERVTGKSISKERIDIYYKLLYQAKLVMTARISDWMDNLFGGLLSSIMEVRNRALICISEVSRVLGKDKAVPRTLTNIFSRQVKGKRMFESIKERLDQFIRDGEGVFVARMWGIVLLCVKTLGDHWEYFTPWLRIIEGCFNVSDKDVKVEAQVAWSKLIYSMNIGPNTTRKLLGLLCKPLEQYLDPKNAYSNTKKPRKAAMANVSVLLYYGFRPTATNKQLSDVWDLVVVGLVEKMALSSKEEVGEGCSILSAIFDSTRPRAWQETRVLATPPMTPEDVPRLDPKWVRSNTALVLNTLEVALRRGHWKEDADKGVKSVWAHFTKTLSDAGSKEIKVSAELMEAVAHLFNMFQRIWTAGPSALLGAKEAPPIVSASFIKKFSFLVVTALQSLGTIPFTEKHLSYDDTAKFSPAATPTHKYSSGGSPAILNPPILHLFQLFLNPPADVFPDEEYYESVRTILWKCVAGLDSRRKKLGLLASCTALLPHRDARDLDHGMWQIFGQLARKCIPREKTALSLGAPPVVAEFRDVVKILEWGCPYDLLGWKRLYEEFCTVVAAEQGEGYIAAVVIEPIAEALRNQAVEKDKYALLPAGLLGRKAADKYRTQSLKKAVMLVEHAAWPKAEKSFLKTPFGGAGRRSLGTDSYEKLCDLLDHLLKRSYALCAEGMPMTDTLVLMAALGDMLTKCPSGSILQLLKRLQEGLGLFIVDEKQIIGIKNTETAAKVYNLWLKVLETLTRLPTHDGKVLDALQGLVTAGLQSKRKQIVNVTVRFWNDTFGEQSSLMYPSSVRSALKKLRPIADLVLPTFPESLEDESANTPPEFSETQSPEPDGEDSARENAWPTTPLRMASPLRIASPLRTASPLRMVSPFRKSMSPGMVKDTPLPTRRTTPGSARKAPPPKLKHMDSQIEFAPVDNGSAETIDSQVLTEHQKEVKERQRDGAAGKLFSSLVIKTEKDAGKEREVVVLEDTPVEDMDVSRIEETQPSQRSVKDEQEETLPLISQMPEETNPQFLLTRPPTQESGDLGSSSEIELSEPELSEPELSEPELSEPEMDSPGTEEWEESAGNDVEMSNPTDDNSDYGSSISELPSIEDDFVDAPDQPSSSPRRNMRMTVEIDTSPATLSTEPSSEKSGHSSPDAQIIDEQRASHGLPATPKTTKGRRKGKKKASPEVLGTIVIASEPPASESSTWYRTRSTRLAEEKGRQGSLEVPEAREGAKTSKSKSVENTPSKASKNATPSKALKWTRSKAVESTPSRVSPPRTRASARRGTSETPKAIAEPASRKRKFLTTDDSPVPGYEGHQSGAEHAPSPTPKGRRRKSDNPPSAKRSRIVEEVPADPDVSFVGETQLSYGSSIPDTYEQEVDELVRATPYAGRAVGIFDRSSEAEGEAASTPGKRRRVKGMVEETPVPVEVPAVVVEVEVESTSVDADMVTPSKRRKMKRRQLQRVGRRSPSVKGSQKSLTETEDETIPPSSQVEISAASESTGAEESLVVVGSSGPSVVPSVVSSVVSSASSEPITGQSAIEGLRSALRLLDTVELTASESRDAEEIILGAFMNIRRRGRD